jgi:hypothetical protein
MGNEQQVNRAYRRLASACILNWLTEYFQLKRQLDKATSKEDIFWYSFLQQSYAGPLLRPSAIHELADMQAEKIAAALRRIDEGKLDPRSMRRVMGLDE